MHNIVKAIGKLATIAQIMYYYDLLIYVCYSFWKIIYDTIFDITILNFYCIVHVDCYP